ncbi:Olfactory receptor 1019 [Sciurus carolinensis]|uniref:Olfactory receptor 1019 n=1 Tax=Sciurus carolinensis TaxID=30640 RepID=A0AA41MET8_SCICA|nr:Olfactory receptor 1019 [Sciurus carolinensis]
MRLENGTVKAEFLLLGFSDHPELQSLLLAVFFSIYSVTLMGNLGMILLITTSSHLHTPMYFFIGMLSFIDSCYSSVIAPKLLVDLISAEKTISYNGCAAQLYFFCSLVDTESFLLAAMAYDSLVEAICLLTVLLSYVCIIAAILRTGSAEARRKGFSTCASHLIVVTIYHGTLIFIYLRPSTDHSLDIDKVTSVFYTLIIPMLNPIIYSLRNKDVKNAFRKMIHQKLVS